MLIVAQFPLADARPFLSTNSHHSSARPSVAEPDVSKSFLDHFGPAKKRVGGGVADLPGEGRYFEISRGLKLPRLERWRWGEKGAQVWPASAFRRLVAYDPACLQMQVGFMHRGKEPLRGLGSSQILSALKDCLNSKPSVLREGGESVEENQVRLCEAGPALASLYLWATTRPGQRAKTSVRPWWVQAGSMSLLVEYDEKELAQLPAQVKQFDLLEEHGIRLAHLWFRHGGNLYSTWFVGVKDDTPQARDLVRRLRLCLFGVYTHWEALRLLFGSIAKRDLPVKDHSRAGDALQGFIRDATGYVTAEQRYGLPQTELLRQTVGCVGMVDEDERTSLLAALERVRPSVHEKAKGTTAAPPRRGLSIFVSYSHRDKRRFKDLCQRLERLKLNDMFAWTDRSMIPGAKFDEEIRKHLDAADIFMPLVSEAFKKSKYIKDNELPRALELWAANKIIIIPVILEHVSRARNDHLNPLFKSLCLPEDGRPVATYVPRDAAFDNIENWLQRSMESLRAETKRRARASKPRR